MTFSSASAESLFCSTELILFFVHFTQKTSRFFLLFSVNFSAHSLISLLCLNTFDQRKAKRREQNKKENDQWRMSILQSNFSIVCVHYASNWWNRQTIAEKSCDLPGFNFVSPPKQWIKQHATRIFRFVITISRFAAVFDTSQEFEKWNKIRTFRRPNKVRRCLNGTLKRQCIKTAFEQICHCSIWEAVPFSCNLLKYFWIELFIYIIPFRV